MISDFISFFSEKLYEKVLAGCRSTVMSCVFPSTSILSGRVLMVSAFSFFLGRFYLHKATLRADSLEPEPAVDGTKTPLSYTET